MVLTRMLTRIQYCAIMNTVHIGRGGNMNRLATSKEALLEIARDIFYREGISKVSIRRLASESGVAIGTVYNYYPSKADLVSDIMEDFWRKVFHGSHFDTESGDFLGSVGEIYRRLSANLAVFERAFLEDLPSMEKAERAKSQITWQKYLDHMKAGVLRILKKDVRIDRKVWTEEFTPEALVDFTFSHIVLALTEGKKDCRYLLLLLEKLLYSAKS